MDLESFESFSRGDDDLKIYHSSLCLSAGHFMQAFSFLMYVYIRHVHDFIFQ